MRQGPILIFTAVDMEARAIVRALGLRRGEGGGWRSEETGGVELHVIGIRSVHVPMPLPAARAVILAGLAGALEPSLRVGDVIVDSASSPLPGADVLPNARVGPIHTAAKMISTPEEKAELFAATGALGVEMENAILRGQIAGSVEHRQLPFLHVRAVSDSASEALDPRLMTMIDSRGRPKALAVAGVLLRHPAMIPHLRRVGASSARACEALAAAVQTLLRCWP